MNNQDTTCQCTEFSKDVLDTSYCFIHHNSTITTPFTSDGNVPPQDTYIEKTLKKKLTERFTDKTTIGEHRFAEEFLTEVVIPFFTTHHSTIIEDLRKGIEGKKVEVEYGTPELEQQYYDRGYNSAIDSVLSLLPSKQEENIINPSPAIKEIIN